MPVPGYFSRPCSRWKMTKIRHWTNWASSPVTVGSGSEFTRLGGYAPLGDLRGGYGDPPRQVAL